MDTLAEVYEYLHNHADELDRWATESQRGGWSTHQVAANRKAADDCRRVASGLRAAISRVYL